MEQSPRRELAFGEHGEGLLATLSAALSGSLPGATGWAPMIPAWARAPEPGREDWREAAVLILLHPLETGFGFPLLLRSEAVAHHRGQISLPGGARERSHEGAAPESLEETALRETEEEIGLARASIGILGRLSPLRIGRSGFSVLPFVGWTDAQPVYKLQEAEVAELIETPLSTILIPGSETEAEVQAEGGRRLVPCYRVDGHVVWGATAMMLAELAAVLRRPASRTDAGRGTRA